MPPSKTSRAKRPPGHWFQRVNANREKGLQAGFRSGLEGNNAAFIESHGQVVQYETLRIPYVVPQQMRHYTPDFRLESGIIVETKGVFDATDRAKHLFIKVQYPKLDIRFVFTRGKAPIAPGSVTTLAEWAGKHGYKWAEKLIPIEWLREAGPEVGPEEVLRLGPEGYQEFLRMERKTK
jgi:hypothetical protein